MPASVEYAFTVTLLPKIYTHPAEKQYDLTYIEIMRILEGQSQAYTLIAELTKGANIHYHGIIKYLDFKAKTNLTKQFIDAFRNSKLFGHINIKQVTDLKGWVDYLQKDIDSTRESINRPPILNDYFNEITSKYADFILHSGYIQYDIADEQ